MRVARGLDPAEARREALRQFGGIEQMKEAHRDDRSARWIENLVKDARYGLAVAATRTRLRHRRHRRARPRHRRQHRHLQPRRRGAAEAAALPQSRTHRPHVGVDRRPALNSTTALNFVELRRRLRTFEAFSAEVDVNATVEIGGEPVRLQGRRRLGQSLCRLRRRSRCSGARFATGRGSAGRGQRRSIISHAAWQQRFGGDPRILDREVLGSTASRIAVIGVMPPGAFDRDRRAAAHGRRAASGSRWP